MKDYERFKSMLEEKLRNNVFSEETLNAYQEAFNSGARTMFHAACTVFMRCQDGKEKGAKSDD